jgi:hypothetical protein
MGKRPEYHRIRRIRQRPFSLFKALTRGAVLSCVVRKNFFFLFRLLFLSKDTRLTALSFFSSQCSKTTINRLSYFLSLSRAVKKREVFEEITSLFHLAVNRAKKRLKDKIYYFEKKKVVFLDWTALSKRCRYRTKKDKGMQYVGEFYDTRKKGPVRGYGLLLAGLYLTTEDILPLSFRLYSNRYISHHPEEKSINKMEEALMREIKEKFSSRIIFVGDAQFSKKMYLYIIKKDMKEDFIVRARFDVNVEEEKRGWENILLIAKEKKKSYRVTWENKERGKFSCKAKFFKADLFSKKDKKHLPIYVILIWEEKKEDEPLLILTSLEVKDNNLQEIVSIYNKRGRIDTLFEILKQNFGLERIMVRKWEGIKIMITGCLLSYTLNLYLLLKATKTFLLTIREFCRRRSILKGGKLTIGKFSWATQKMQRSPPVYV